MFENQRVGDVAQLFARVAGAIPVKIEESIALGGRAVSAQLDRTVIINVRPVGGKWVAQVHALDDGGRTRVTMVPSVLHKNVPDDQVVIWILYALGIFGTIQIDAENEEVLPSEEAAAGRGKFDAHEWGEFRDRWMFAIATLHFMATGRLACLPANRFTPYDAQGLAAEILPMLTEELPAFMRSDFQL